MPTYTYKCRHCGKEFEVKQKMSDKPLEKCPTCGVPHLQKVITNGSFQLKGKGWFNSGGY